MVFGVHDWAARIPVALSAILLCWLVVRFGAWAFSLRAGFYAGLSLATCVGLFLFTRILIPDVVLTLTMTLAMWAFLRALDDREPHPRRWAWVVAASLAAGVLLKGLIGILFPAGAAFFYLLFTRRLFARRTWQRLHPFSGLLVFLLIAAPWHVLATLRNPPYFDFTMHSEPGKYRGFFWFYFINEHVLRFLNLRYPRDYNTVPRLYFWLFHLLWLFPWSVQLPALGRLSYRPADRAGRARLLALCWIGFVLVFFSFSTTQEYYSMPIYPAVALLAGCAMASGGRWIPVGTKIAAAIAAVAALVSGALLVRVWNLPAPGDISAALSQNPDLYTLSLGHAADLTLNSLGLPARAAGMGRSGLPGGRSGSLAAPREAGHFRAGADDGDFLAGRAPGPGGLRPVPVLAAAGRGAPARSARAPDSGRPVLHLLLGGLLCRFRRAVVERPRQ